MPANKKVKCMLFGYVTEQWPIRAASHQPDFLMD